MPQKSWAVGEEVLAADFNSYLQNQVVPQFASTAERDAQWTAPPNGAMCVTADTGTRWQRFTGLWYQSYGRLGYAQATANTAAIGTTETNVPGLSLSITVPAGRRLRVEAYCRCVNTPANGVGFWRLNEPAVAMLQEAQIPGNSTGAGPFVYICAMLTPSAGTHPYNVSQLASAGTITAQAGPTFPMWLAATDLGGA